VLPSYDTHPLVAGRGNPLASIHRGPRPFGDWRFFLYGRYIIEQKFRKANNVLKKGLGKLLTRKKAKKSDKTRRLWP
jgi:hypothetical protein